MIIHDLIKNKDYDTIYVYITSPPSLHDEKYIFFGLCKSECGKLISLDGDSYNEFEEVIEYEEFSRDKIKNELNVFCRADWISTNYKNELLNELLGGFKE